MVAPGLHYGFELVRVLRKLDRSLSFRVVWEFRLSDFRIVGRCPRGSLHGFTVQGFGLGFEFELSWRKG